jgi:DNA-directed RNA polymerase beta subunit
MVLQKKPKTHKAKSTERILLQQNHRSKNIIICEKIPKQSKQNSYTSLEIIFLKYIIFSIF